MLEESKMDKKFQNRLSQSQPKASAVDCKKNTDSTHKPWPRNNKKRESTNIPKNDPNRRSSVPQKGKGVDKRPRTRAPNVNMGGAPNARVVDDEPEIGSVFVPGSKKQNLNHLLKFMYPIRGGPGSKISQPRRQAQYRAVRHESDLYLRANCQFVVKENEQVKVNVENPDMPIKWEMIEEIVVRSTGRSECPICLGIPTAARVGLCGHVYCWACVLHYAAAHEKQPPPCPVCATSLQVKNMKPTRMVQWEAPGEEITMRLVRRLRSTNIVERVPVQGEDASITEKPVLPIEEITNAPYCKFFSITDNQIQQIVERERKETQQQILAEIDTTEIIYLEQVLKLLKQKEEEININNHTPKVIKEDIIHDVPTIYEKQDMNEKKYDWFNINSDGDSPIDISKPMKELDLNTVQSILNPSAQEFTCDYPEDVVNKSSLEENANNEFVISDSDKEKEMKYFYFYQANDGQLVFLDSLNVRILKKSWGSLAAAPLEIHGRVLNRSTYSLTAETREHMPCTSHLPLHCSFDIVDLELKPPHVTTAAVNWFSEELFQRARSRAKHEREERRRERAYRRAMEGPPKPDFNSEILFPPTTSYQSSISVSETLEMAPSTSMTVTPSPSGPSFAKMAASTSGTWRVRKVTAPPTPPPVEEDPSTPRALCLSDAIQAALEATPITTGKKNKKSSKSKHKVLFATGIQHTD